VSILSQVGLLVAGEVADIFLKSGRAIGTIIPQCTIEERARDELAITEHPIQTGAPITDHAYKIPSTVTARYGWSQSGAIFNLTSGGILSSDPKDVYDQLRMLQENRQPFQLITGKRTYDNMLIQTLEQVTDKATEHALAVTITFKEVFLVNVVEVQVVAENQADPAQTAPVVNKGTVQPKPVQQSVLSSIAGFVGG